MQLDELKEAINSGHKASSILREVLREISKLHCPKSYGFEGAKTFSGCGKCVVCFAKGIMGPNALGNGPQEEAELK